MISLDNKTTTSDGRFIVFNLEPGVGHVEAQLNGEPVAPFLISAVEGGELLYRTLQISTGAIKGRIFDPVTSPARLRPVAGARVRIEGSAEWSSTDSYGAFSIGPVRWVKGERISLEFSAGRFNNHRYSLQPDRLPESLSLFAFPANYIYRLAHSMEVELDSTGGIVLGKVAGSSLRVDALADHSVQNNAKDFYFDARGRLKGSHSRTDPRFGTYVIFNVPSGRILLHGNDGAGQLRYSEAVVSSPASVSVVMD
jgi:hypothetical protein